MSKIKKSLNLQGFDNLLTQKIKCTMKKNFILLLILLISTPSLIHAQYATGGNGKYANSIYWLTWYWATDAESGLQSFVPRANPSVTYRYNDRTQTEINVDEGTYIWQLSKFIRVEGVLTNKVGAIVKYAPNSYSTNGFQYMYKGFENKDQSIGNFAGVKTPVGFDLVLNVQVLRNNVWRNIDPTNHGVVFTESESLSKTEEYVECLVDAKSSWYLIEGNDTNREVNPRAFISDCGYKITTSSVTDNSISKKKVRLDNIGGEGQFGRYAILYAHGVNKFDKLRIVGQGITHIALGYLINQDIANAEGYEGAYHLQELVTSGNPATRLVPLAATTKLCENPTLSIPDAKLTTTVYIGKAPNVENVADTNNNLDGITQSVAVRSNVSTNLTMTFATTNTLPNTEAYAYVWLDKNNNKRFEANEGQVFTIPANSYDVINTITYDNLNLNTGDYIFRIRITTDALEDIASTSNIDERSVKMASNGEVTDYIINVTPQPLPLTLITFEGKVAPHYNIIEWKTAKESELKYYELQTSTDGSTWNTIETIAAKNQAGMTSYTTNDYEIAPQKLYRLYIVEENSANNSYSRILKLERKMEQSIIVFPNPASEAIHINHVQEGQLITITNSLGQIVNSITTNSKHLTIPVLNLTKGTYIISIYQDNKQLHQQAVVVK